MSSFHESRKRMSDQELAIARWPSPNTTSGFYRGVSGSRLSDNFETSHHMKVL